MGYYSVIGFSGKIGSGKSSTSKEVMKNIFDKDFKVISFADSLRSEVSQIISTLKEVSHKEQCHKFDIFSEISNRDIDYIYTTLNDKVKNDSSIHSRSHVPEVRAVMQYWGTSVRRKQDNDYFVKKNREQIQQLHNAGYHVAIDDVRYENEAVSVINNDGILVRLEINEELQKERIIKRDSKYNPNALKHTSETALDEFPFFDYIYYASKDKNLQKTAEEISDDLSLRFAEQMMMYSLEKHNHI